MTSGRPLPRKNDPPYPRRVLRPPRLRPRPPGASAGHVGLARAAARDGPLPRRPRAAARASRRPSPAAPLRAGAATVVARFARPLAASHPPGGWTFGRFGRFGRDVDRPKSVPRAVWHPAFPSTAPPREGAAHDRAPLCRTGIFQLRFGWASCRIAPRRACCIDALRKERSVDSKPKASKASSDRVSGGASFRFPGRFTQEDGSRSGLFNPDAFERKSFP